MATAKKTAKAPKDIDAINENEVVSTEAVALVEEKLEMNTAKKSVAKAGKRSAKAIEETEAKIEKEERKASDIIESDKPKQHSNPTRSHLTRRSKGYRKSAELIEAGKLYSLKEAMEVVSKTSSVKFDASVELHINLLVDPRQADQNIRANLVLPAGTGKNIRVAVFADDDVEGADVTGIDQISKDLEKGTISFDILISTPTNMAKLGKYARLLGPRGLMPNPKSGTVTTDVVKAVKEAKAGRVEFRVDSTGIVHLAIGKVSFGGAKLLENAQAVMSSIRSAKPASVKGNYVKAIHATTTMGPSVSISISE